MVQQHPARTTTGPGSAQPGEGTSLYVHVPFCVVKCGYCDFNSYVVEDRSVVDRFLDALEAELAHAQLPRVPVSVFVGGGTPTHLDEPQFERLFALLRARVDLGACAEVTMEANPESVTREKAAIAHAAGVRRFSMGVQSFHERHLRFLDRAHDATRVHAAVDALRSAGASNLSLDMIFSVPGQTLAEWESDLAQALALQPDHLSCYNLTYEPGTRLHRDLQQGKFDPNDEELDRAMFLRTREVLSAAGYRPYEISNFAGRGGPCRHNDHYWLQGDYVGVGPGAASHRNGVRTTNLKPVEAWARSVLGGRTGAGSAETLSLRQRAGEAVWLGIRRAEGVDLARIGARLGMDALRMFGPTVDGFVRDGLLRLDRTRIVLTDQGLLLGDRVGSAFLMTD